LLIGLFALAVAAEEIPVVRFTVSGFQVSGENPVDPGETERILAGYTGDYAGLDGLLAVVDAFQAELNARGFAFRRVILPPQTLDGGVVTLKIVPITIASVTVAGAEHFSEANILRSVPAIQQDASPDQELLSGSLELANRHTSKQVSVRLRESERADAVDAIIDVEDRRPWQLFTGLNNIGTRDTGRTRVTVGAQHSNLFDRDHSMVVSYTTSPENQKDVMQAGASYDLPLYFARSKLSAFFSESDVSVGSVSGFDISGAGRFWGVSLTRLLKRRGAYSHEWQLGIQDRFFENDVNFVFAGTRLPLGVNVRSYPVTLGYTGSYEAPQWNIGFNVDYSKNLGFGDRNNDATYRASRFRANSDWDAIRFNGAVTYYLPWDLLARMEISGQWANEPLISGEQFGLGGARSIRGLDERSVLGDSGFRLGTEVYSPPIPYSLGLRVIGFVDLGFIDRAEAQPGEIESDTVSSAGLGLRWQWRGLSINLDYGHTLAEGEGLTAQADDAGGVRWHFNVFYIF
jgi:hemolysin activation/secretion protein